MSIHDFDPKCADCRPALLDLSTGKQLPLTHPAMVAAHKIWDEELTLAQQRSLHNVWIKNSRAPDDLNVVLYFSERLGSMLGN